MWKTVICNCSASKKEQQKDILGPNCLIIVTLMQAAITLDTDPKNEPNFASTNDEKLRELVSFIIGNHINSMWML